MPTLGDPLLTYKNVGFDCIVQSPAALNCDGDGVSRAEREGDNDTVPKA